MISDCVIDVPRTPCLPSILLELGVPLLEQYSCNN